MKYMKMLSLAAVAAMAFAAFAASSASATALEVEGVGKAESVTIKASLKSGTSAILKDTAGSATNTCTSSSVQAATSSPFTGSSVTGSVSSLSFGTCTRPVTVHKAGNLELTYTSGTNASVASEGAEVTVGTPFGTVACVTGATTNIGTLTGVASGNATVDINAVLNCGFLMPSAKWEGTYSVTSPEGLGAVPAVPIVELDLKNGGNFTVGEKIDVVVTHKEGKEKYTVEKVRLKLTTGGKWGFNVTGCLGKEVKENSPEGTEICKITNVECSSKEGEAESKAEFEIDLDVEGVKVTIIPIAAAMKCK